MAYKISFLIIPLVISSIAKIPSFSDFNHPNVVSKPFYRLIHLISHL